MKHLKSFNESLRDKMKPKTEEEIWNSLKNHTPSKMLEISIYNNYLKGISKAIEMGAKINIIGRLGRTPLFDAVINKNFNKVETLIKYGADVDLKDDDNRTALDIISRWGENDNETKKIINILKKNSKKLSNDEKIKFMEKNYKPTDMLIQSYKQNFEEGIKRSLELRANVNELLLNCVESGDLLGVEKSIELGANITYQNNKPFKYAFANHNYDKDTSEISKLFLNKNIIDPSIENNYPLRISIKKNKKDIINLLLKDKRVLDKLSDTEKILYKKYLTGEDKNSNRFEMWFEDEYIDSIYKMPYQDTIKFIRDGKILFNYLNRDKYLLYSQDYVYKPFRKQFNFELNTDQIEMIIKRAFEEYYDLDIKKISYNNQFMMAR